jgi:hypothetical protein
MMRPVVIEETKQAEWEIRREMRRLKGELKALDKQARFIRERRRSGRKVYILRKKEFMEETRV